MAVKQATEAKTIRLELFAPGMTPLHRAGLGGLACTLDAVSRTRSDLPLQYEINADSIILQLPESAPAANALQRLFDFGFQINADGLIFLPGQFTVVPEPAVLADLQAGSLLTFLQHGKSRKLAKKESQVSHCFSEKGDWEIPVTFRKCSWFKHQAGWKELIDSQGDFQSQPVRIEGSIFPGASVRHFAFKHQTAIKEPLERVLPLYFALVGCLSLPVNRGVGVLLVPEVQDLHEFIHLRPRINPQYARECRVTNAADAILQAKQRAGAQLGISAVTFQPTSWTRQQKSRVKTCEVGALDDSTMVQFQKAYTALPPRVVSDSNDPKSAPSSIRAFQAGYRVDSVVRSLIAENLVAESPWYSGFASLMSRINPVSGKPFRDQIVYERRGLQKLVVDQGLWGQEREWKLVDAIQDAVQESLIQIQSRAGGPRSFTAVAQSHQGWFYEKLRLDLVGAQTPGQLRFVLTELFQQGSAKPAQLGEWHQSLAFIDEDWQRSRDLSLLVLVSSGGRFSEVQTLRKSA